MINELEKWLSDKPDIIKNMALRFPPTSVYRIKNTGQKGMIVSYSESEEFTLLIRGHDSKFLESMYAMIPMTVFGLKPEDIEEVVD